MGKDTTACALPAPAAAPARRFQHQVHVLVDEPTRAYTLGLAIIAAREGGYATLKEGEQIRELFDDLIAQRYAEDPGAYSVAVNAGREEMRAREQRAFEASANPARDARVRKARKAAGAPVTKA